MLSKKSLSNKKMKNLKERLTTAVDSILVEELEILHILYGMQIIPCKKEHTMTNTFDLRSLNQDLLNEEKGNTRGKSNRPTKDIYRIRKNGIKGNKGI